MHSNGYICDRLVIGAGFYGLYSALFCGRLGQKVIVLEKEPEAFTRASYINQARVHMGYHYPRSISTAIKSDKYFERFCDDLLIAFIKTSIRFMLQAAIFPGQMQEISSNFAGMRIFPVPRLTKTNLLNMECAMVHSQQENTYMMRRF